MKQKMVLILAVGMGILAFALTHLYLKTELRKLTAGMRKVAIVVAREELTANTVLDTSNTADFEVFERGLSDRVFRVEDRKLAMGRTLLYPVRKGEPIMWHHIGASNLRELSGLADLVPNGMRAMSIPVSTDTAVSGLIRPNDRVDILGTFSFIDQANPEEMETVTFTVLQDVAVLATGQETARVELEISSSRRSSSYNTVTIAVFPEEAELLAFAMNVKGTLTLTLRDPEDNGILDQTPPLNFQALQRELPRLNERRRRERPDAGPVNLLQRP